MCAVSNDTNEKPGLVGNKIATRPGSQWAHGKRKQQKGFDQPKGFARGCRVYPKSVTQSKDS
jgi:hypothetical protein